jgi:hypothetical protein
MVFHVFYFGVLRFIPSESIGKAKKNYQKGNLFVML